MSGDPETLIAQWGARTFVGSVLKLGAAVFVVLLPLGAGFEVGRFLLFEVLTPHVPYPIAGVLALGLLASTAFYLTARFVGRGRRGRTSGAELGAASRSARGGTHGTAHWGSGRDLVRPDGLVLGRQIRGRKPGPLLRYDGPGHALTVAPTRSGKGVGALVPNLLDHPGAVVVTDPKGENYAVTARRRRQLGADVQALDPFGVVGGAAAFNPLDALDPAGEDAVDDAALIADMLVVSREGSGGTSEFFNNEARALLSGLVLHVAAGERGPRRSLPRVRELLTLPPEEFAGLLKTMQKSKAAHGLVARAAARLRQKGDKERAAVVSSAQNHTHFLDSPRMRRVLERSTFEFSALKRPTFGLSVGADGALTPGRDEFAVRAGNGYLSLYLVLPPDRLDTYRGWLRLMIASALLSTARTPGQPEERVLFLLDEFAQLGRMDPVLRAYSLMAGYGVQLWAFLQDLSQLRGTYPDKWGTFLSNADVLQAFGTNDHETAELLSKMLGDATVLSANAGQNRGTTTPIGMPSWNRGRTEGHSEAARPLLTPDEVRRLPPDEQLLFVKGAAPVRARKVRYYADADFRGHHDPNPTLAAA